MGNLKAPMSSSADSATGPRVAFAGPAPTPEEAAAAVAAIERFVAETMPAPAAIASVSAWRQAALIEGVSAKHRAFPPDPGAGFPVTG